MVICKVIKAHIPNSISVGPVPLSPLSPFYFHELIELLELTLGQFSIEFIAPTKPTDSALLTCQLVVRISTTTTAKRSRSRTRTKSMNKY